MSKTIFDYDSSDSEETYKKSVKDINNVSINSNILYNTGNAVLHNEGIFTKYLNKKKEYFKNKPLFDSVLINKFLTKKEYTDKEKNLNSLNDLQASLPYINQQQAKGDIQTIIIATGELYKQLEQNLPEDGIINTENFKCFRVLNSLNDWKKLKSQDKGEIAAAFNISEEQVQKFLGSISKIKNIKATIADLINLSERSSNLLNNEIMQIIIDTENSKDSNYIEAVLQITEKCNDQIKTLTNSHELYKQLEQNLPEDGIINTENFKCFRVLNSLNDWKKLKSQDKGEIAAAFNISEEQVQKFLGSISKIQDIKTTITNLINLTRKSSNLLNEKIINHITSKRDALNFDFTLDILCDKQLYNLSNKLSEFDNIVRDKIKELPFFNTANNSAHDNSSQGFLVSSLLYQKLLKTITKFTLLRTYGNEMDSNVKYDENKSYSKTISTKNKLSTGLKRTEEISGLGSYDNISKILQNAQSKLNLDNKTLIKAFKSILKGDNLYKSNFVDNTKQDAIKTLYDITYLLFSCEANRNPAALISNSIFLDLVEKGMYKIGDMVTCLPMAMEGAIEIGRYLHTQSKLKRVNDYGATNKKPNNCDEFRIKEAILLYKLLGIKTKSLEEALALIDENKTLEKSKKEKSKKEKIKINEQINTISKEIEETTKQYEGNLKNNKELITKKLNELVKDWYGIDSNFIMKAAGEKSDESDNSDSSGNHHKGNYSKEHFSQGKGFFGNKKQAYMARNPEKPHASDNFLSKNVTTKPFFSKGFDIEYSVKNKEFLEDTKEPCMVRNPENPYTESYALPQYYSSSILADSRKRFMDTLRKEHLDFIFDERRKKIMFGKDFINGITEYEDGLTSDSINLNLKHILKSNNQSQIYISYEIINQQQVLDSLLHWLANYNTFNQYASLVKVENLTGEKHAVLLHAIQESDIIKIVLIDPLSQEDSEFIAPLNALKIDLSNLMQANIKIIYAGCQDKEYGTCGDMSLIMLQELIEKTPNKAIATIDNQVMVDNCIDIEHDDNHNLLCGNYDDLHIQLSGSDMDSHV